MIYSKRELIEENRVGQLIAETETDLGFDRLTQVGSAVQDGAVCGLVDSGLLRAAKCFNMTAFVPYVTKGATRSYKERIAVWQTHQPQSRKPLK